MRPISHKVPEYPHVTWMHLIVAVIFNLFCGKLALPFGAKYLYSSARIQIRILSLLATFFPNYYRDLWTDATTVAAVILPAVATVRWAATEPYRTTAVIAPVRTWQPSPCPVWKHERPSGHVWPKSWAVDLKEWNLLKDLEKPRLVVLKFKQTFHWTCFPTKLASWFKRIVFLVCCSREDLKNPHTVHFSYILQSSVKTDFYRELVAKKLRS